MFLIYYLFIVLCSRFTHAYKYFKCILWITNLFSPFSTLHEPSYFLKYFIVFFSTTIYLSSCLLYSLYLELDMLRFMTRDHLHLVAVLVINSCVKDFSKYVATWRNEYIFTGCIVTVVPIISPFTPFTVSVVVEFGLRSWVLRCLYVSHKMVIILRCNWLMDLRPSSLM